MNGSKCLAIKLIVLFGFTIGFAHNCSILKAFVNLIATDVVCRYLSLCRKSQRCFYGDRIDNML